MPATPTPGSISALCTNPKATSLLPATPISGPATRIRYPPPSLGATEICRAVYADPKRSAEAFSRCWRVDPSVESILDHVIPPDRAAYLDVIRELATADQLAATLTVWQRLVSLHPRMSPPMS